MKAFLLTIATISCMAIGPDRVVQWNDSDGIEARSLCPHLYIVCVPAVDPHGNPCLEYYSVNSEWRRRYSIPGKPYVVRIYADTPFGQASYVVREVYSNGAEVLTFLARDEK